ncbi:hypothetical protein [Mycolicibacterium obuense]|uniref:hypothetical protein n=1 Tax=Mycolicibacterium obuense TaxID=1807 RepID=UPI0023F80ADC|nr:hypothetical protein [Mycolicibacterium obuense]
MSGRGEQKFWTWLILGLLAFFIGVPFVLTILGNLTKKANKYASGVDWTRIGTLFMILCVVVLVLWFLFAVLGGSGGGKHTGARALADAERAKIAAIEQVRAHHAHRMYTQRAENARMEAGYRTGLLEGRAELDHKWVSAS